MVAGQPAQGLSMWVNSVRFSSPNGLPFHPRMSLGCKPHPQSMGILEMLNLFTQAERKQPGKSVLSKSHKALQSRVEMNIGLALHSCG